ncbi:hypothetical protein GIB67_036909 [Kingdonia uniflora]|uniref:CCHC-type domain-containing protein n=1 Tax=Kingdonia uniflora TaxID=39325 RepID=A0A7J7NVL0_9MAGN|nr:hypothetical protein GIB67_036909 [Kingdonia uniflora]
MPNSQNYTQLRPQTLQTHVHKHQQTHVPAQQSSLIGPRINTDHVQGVASYNPTSLRYDHCSPINSYQQGQLYPLMPLTNTVPVLYVTGLQYPPGNGFRDASANDYRYADFGDDSRKGQYYEGEHYAPSFEQHSQFNGHGRGRGFNPLVGTPVHDQHERPMGSPPRAPRHPYATRYQDGDDCYTETRFEQFDGKSDADAFIDWLDKVEKISTYKRYGDLKQGYPMITESSKMRRDMKERFIPMNNEQQQVSKYKNGLTKKLQDMIALQHVYCLSENSKHVEDGTTITQSRPPVPVQTTTFPAILTVTAPRTYVLGNCYGCGKPGHQKRDCPTFAKKVGLVIDGMRKSVIATIQRVLEDEDEDGIHTTFVCASFGVPPP